MAKSSFGRAFTICKTGTVHEEREEEGGQVVESIGRGERI